MDLTGKRLVLIGGAGFIGSHIAEQLLAKPVREIVVIDNFCRGKRENLPTDSRLTVIEDDMTDPYFTRKAIEGADGVFLLASLWLGECVADPRGAWETNVLGTYNVVAACEHSQVKRLIYSSSASVYGDAVVVPMTEDHPLNNRTHYGATKIACEQMLRAAHAQHGLDHYLALRYMNVYGPRMDRLGTYVSVIMKALDRILQNEPPVIYGDGSQEYDFVYVEDVARANVLAMEAEATDVALNVGTGVGTTVAALVDEILAVAGSKVRPEFLAHVQSFVARRVGSTELAEKLIGFRAQVPLREGLERTVAWRRACG